VSPSASPGWQDYTRGEYASLPTGILDLTTPYSAGDITDVATSNNVRVSQQATLKYAVHQFKDYVETDSCRIEVECQSNLAPAFSPIYLQIFNRSNPSWDTIASNNSAPVDTDFVLAVDVLDVANYKDTHNTIVCRIYQLAV
jgi:hypothetical protein